MPAKRGRKDLRGDGRDEAVDISDAGSHRDQGEHVEVAGHQRLPAAHEERPARPDHDRCRRDELNPVRQRLVDPAMAADQMPAHLEDDCGQRQHEADPEPSGHVRQFGIRCGVQRCHFGLQSHSADRAVAGPDLPDFRMHRACVNGAFRNRLLRRGLGLIEVGFRSGRELRATACRTEMVGAALVIEPVLARRRVDGHPANRVEDFLLFRGRLMMPVIAVGLAAMLVSCHRGGVRLARGTCVSRPGHLGLLIDL